VLVVRVLLLLYPSEDNITSHDEGKANNPKPSYQHFNHCKKPRDSSLHNNDENSNHNHNNSSSNNNKAKTTITDKSNEMLKAITASHINIDETGTTATKHTKQLPGNKAQQSPTTTTLKHSTHAL
jgi:hypothetical protein